MAIAVPTVRTRNPQSASRTAGGQVGSRLIQIAIEQDDYEKFSEAISGSQNDVGDAVDS